MHSILKIAIMIFICHKFKESRPAVSPKVTILSFLENIFIVIFYIKLDVGFNQKLCISFGICKNSHLLRHICFQNNHCISRPPSNISNEGEMEIVHIKVSPTGSNLVRPKE